MFLLPKCSPRGEKLSRTRKKGLHTLNPFNAELNLICHLVALLGAHYTLHVSRARVNLGSYMGLSEPPHDRNLFRPLAEIQWQNFSFTFRGLNRGLRAQRLVATDVAELVMVSW